MFYYGGVYFYSGMMVIVCEIFSLVVSWLVSLLIMYVAYFSVIHCSPFIPSS